VTFPLFKKIKVNGKEADPLYVYLKEQAKGAFGNAIKWNFTKFLIDRDGNVLDRYESKTTPEELDSIISELL
jgi:glutathione peroxidase